MLLPFAAFVAPGGSAAPAPLNVIGTLVLLLVVAFCREFWFCRLPDVPEVVELPLVLLDVEPEAEVEVEPEVEVCAFAGRLCSASAVTASAAKLKRAFMMG